MGTILAIPTAWAAGGVILGFVISGALFVLGIFKKEKTADTKDGEDALTFVNEALDKKIKVLTDQISEQAKKLDDQDKRIVAIEKENALLREILQGRDADAQRFQKEGFEAIANAKEILRITTDTNKNMNQLCKSIDGLVKAINVQTTVTVKPTV